MIDSNERHKWLEASEKIEKGIDEIEDEYYEIDSSRKEVTCTIDNKSQD